MKINIYIATQTLDLLADDGTLLKRYEISSAEKGCGELKGSYQTPRGRHIIRAKIGAGVPMYSVFRARRPTGEILTPALEQAFPERDWILSRILWLSGCDLGFNRLGRVDTMQRYIYIHGTPDSVQFGLPQSHGCIRMHNNDVMDLFERVTVGTEVEIMEDGFNGDSRLSTVRYQQVSWPDSASELTALRHQVFVEEQGVPVELEIDEHDASAIHFAAWAPSGRLIATVRLVDAHHIGRLAVSADWRGRGVGVHLLQLAMDAAKASGATLVDLNAQVAALDFYQKRGFSEQSAVFDDAGIPHKHMIYKL